MEVRTRSGVRTEEREGEEEERDEQNEAERTVSSDLSDEKKES